MRAAKVPTGQATGALLGRCRSSWHVLTLVEAPFPRRHIEAMAYRRIIHRYGPEFSPGSCTMTTTTHMPAIR